jgi:hypothetical protein
MVAESACPTPVSPAAFLPPSPGTAVLAQPELPPAATATATATVAATMTASTAAAVAPELQPEAEPVAEMHPGFMGSVQRAPDNMHWFVFGGTAAFLCVIWMAIWLVAGK